jgi:LPXTG-motif cell wall-anchored protein
VAPSPSTATSSAPSSGSAATTPATVTSGKTLPYTGYDGWKVAALGAVALGAGLVARRRTRRS